VLNNDHAMVKLKRVFNERSKALVTTFGNNWRHKYLLYIVFSTVFENHFPKVYKIVVL
jgi:hypothetical protein